MTPGPNPTQGRGKPLHQPRLAAVRWLLSQTRPATLAELCRGLGDHPDTTRAVYDREELHRLHPWFEGNRHRLSVSWSGWEAASVDPLASVRSAVARCRNVSTIAEMLVHVRQPRHEARADEADVIHVRIAE